MFVRNLLKFSDPFILLWIQPPIFFIYTAFFGGFQSKPIWCFIILLTIMCKIRMRFKKTSKMDFFKWGLCLSVILLLISVVIRSILIDDVF